MGRMRCGCGHVMSDVQAPCPTAGDLIGDVAADVVLREWGDAVNEFIAAVLGGRRDAWLSERGFSPTTYPPTDNADVVADLLGIIRDPRSKRVFECERCGRLHIQTRAFINEWRTFRPESGAGYERVLAPPDAV